MKEQDAAHSFDWITHEKAFKLSCPRPTIPPEKLVYQHAVMELKKADAELTRLRSELQDTKDYFEKQQKHLIDEHFNDLQQERENVIREVMEEFDALEYAKYTVLEINQVLQSLIAKSKAK